MQAGRPLAALAKRALFTLSVVYVISFSQSAVSLAAAKSGAKATDKLTTQEKIKSGVSIKFDVTPLEGKEVREGEYANLNFHISDANTGEPVKGIYPAVWIDQAAAWNRKKDGGRDLRSCKDRVSLYLQGIVGMRPMVDLNSYFVLAMNDNATISVIDPIIGITGITKLYTSIRLKAPGEEWTKTRDEKTLFVSMPKAKKIAVIDLTNFTVADNVDSGPSPLRLALQPDEKYLWVASDSNKAGKSGVAVIDAAKRKKVAFIKTGLGHHELAFSHDSRYAFVSNRDSNSVSIIDIRKLKKIHTIKSGLKKPVGIAYSSMSESLYITDGINGKIMVVDGSTHKLVKKIDARPGVGPVGISQDGRWLIAANSFEDVVYTVDVSTNSIAHTLKVQNKPYQVAFSRAFAYVRALGSERVSMFELALLEKKDTVPVISFAAGKGAPGKVRDLSVAQSIQEAPGEAAVLVNSPTDNTIYYYMEGMNAPQGNFRNYGARPRAVQVADRTLGETAPGMYSAKVKIPAAGNFDVAFLMESPSILHCFSMKAEADEKLQAARRSKTGIEYLSEKRKYNANEDVTIRFRLSEPETGKPRKGLKDVRVRHYRAPSYDLEEDYAKEVEKGIYEYKTRLSKKGVYYFYVASRQAKSTFGDMPYMTVQVVDNK